MEERFCPKDWPAGSLLEIRHMRLMRTDYICYIKKRAYYLHVTVSSVHTKTAADVTLRVHHPFDSDVFRQFMKVNFTCSCSKVFLYDASCCFRYEDYTPYLVSQWPPSLSCIQSNQESEKVEYTHLQWSGICNQEEEKIITMTNGTVVALILYLEDAGPLETSSCGNLCIKAQELSFSLPVTVKDTSMEENTVKEIWLEESCDFERQLDERLRKIEKQEIFLQNLRDEISTFWTFVWSKQQEIQYCAENINSPVPHGCELSAELEDSMRWEALPDAAQLRTQSERLRLEGTCLRTLRAVREELTALREGNRLAHALVHRYGNQLSQLRSTISAPNPVHCQNELLKLVEARDNVLSIGKFALDGSLLRHLNHSIQTIMKITFDDNQNQNCNGPNFTNK